MAWPHAPLCAHCSPASSAARAARPPRGAAASASRVRLRHARPLSAVPQQQLAGDAAPQQQPQQQHAAPAPASSRRRRRQPQREAAAQPGLPAPAGAHASQRKQQQPRGGQRGPAASPAAQQPAGAIPPLAVWSSELRHLQSLLADPNKPLVREFVLQHCYSVNSEATRAAFRSLQAGELARLIRHRLQLERRLSLSAHALSAAWRRQQLLAEAVADQGAALTEEQLNKERELVVDIRDRLRVGQGLLDRASATATRLGDAAFMQRTRLMRRVLAGFTQTAEGYLSHGLRAVAAASRINAAFRAAWQATPPAQRPAPAAAEAQRQAQLAQLQPLLPAPPGQVLAQYRQAALQFTCYHDASLLQRRPSPGQPTSMGAAFKQAGSAAPAAWAPLPGSPSPPWTPGAAGQQALEQHEQQQPGHEQDQQQLQQQLQPLEPGQAAWQQPPQRLTMRPLQQLPLLPHLARPWIKQQTAAFWALQQQLRVEQQLRHGPGRGAPQPVPQPPDRSPASSLSGQVVPPLPVLLQRALRLEQQLLQQTAPASLPEA